ncbi:MAG: hypothetical protein AAFU64_17720, partial [Bacteroidota bacterium]
MKKIFQAIYIVSVLLVLSSWSPTRSNIEFNNDPCEIIENTVIKLTQDLDNGSPEFSDHIRDFGTKAWESAIKNKVAEDIRRNKVFLEMLDKFPYGTGKKTLIDNATSDDWTQIFSGGLKKSNNPDP